MSKDWSLIQAQLEAALYNWVIGKKQDLLDFASNNPKILDEYAGTGNIENYFFPLLYVKEMCTGLMSVGFPVEQIMQKNQGDLQWMDWPEVVNYLCKYNSAFVKDVVSDGVLSEDTIGDIEPLGCYSPDEDKNCEILYAYWPSLLQKEVFESALNFVNSSNNEWDERFNRLESTLKKYNKCSSLG